MSWGESGKALCSPEENERSRYMLYKNGNIFTVIGNNDTPFLNWLRGEVEDEAVCAWMHQRSHSMFLDVAEALALPYETADQVSFLRQTAVRVFSEEFAFPERPIS